MSRQNIQTLIMKLVSMAKTIPEEELILRVTEALSQSDTSERKVKPEYVIKRTLKRLEDMGSVERHESNDGEPTLTLTDTGSGKLHRASVAGPSSVMPTLWDGVWRMVILDFESDDKRSRDAVRYMLKKANFLCLKQSVWITPHNLDGFVAEMKYHMKLTSEVLFVLAQRIDPEVEREVKEYFGIE
jgi:DNA-binding transcriptional regulator PaaX